VGNGGGGGVVVRNSGVGAVVTGRAGCCSAAAVFVSGAKVSFEEGEGFVGGGFLAPFVAGGVEEAGVFNDGVAVTDGGGVSDSVVAGDGEADGFVELIEDAVDGLFGCPGMFHGEEVCFEFRGGDITVGGPEISEKFKGCEVAPTEFFVVKALNVCGRKSGEELFEKRLVGVDVGGEDFLVFDVLTVCFGDLRCGGSR